MCISKLYELTLPHFITDFKISRISIDIDKYFVRIQVFLREFFYMETMVNGNS